MNTKSQKELAFLHDLYIATDWSERFAELVDDHVELPKEGQVLYIAAGTGGHALALQERAGEKLEIIAIDENEECLELARAKATALHEQTKFQHENVAALSFADDRFDSVLGNASFTQPTDLSRNLAEMVRVARPGATVAWWLPTASSFGEFFSIYWEALLKSELEDHGADVETLISDLPKVSDAEYMAEEAGLQDVASWTNIEEFDFESGQEFLNSPLITDFLLHNWLQSVPESARGRVVEELANIIDEERHEGEFALSIKATLIIGTKNRTQ